MISSPSETRRLMTTDQNQLTILKFLTNTSACQSKTNALLSNKMNEKLWICLSYLVSYMFLKMITNLWWAILIKLKHKRNQNNKK